MATAKKSPRKVPSMADEDRAFFENAYKNNPTARREIEAKKKEFEKKAVKKTGKK